MVLSEEIASFVEKMFEAIICLLHLPRQLRERGGRFWGVVAYSMAQLVSAERLFARGAVKVCITPLPPPIFIREACRENQSKTPPTKANNQ